jgi:hypothetical protein
MNSKKLTRALPLIIGLALLVGCSEDPKGRTDGGGGDALPAEGGTPEGPGLMGTVKDTAGVAVEGVQVEAGGQMAFTTFEGKYTLDKLTPGQVTVQLTQDWFKSKTETATVQDTGMTTLDVTIEEHPLKLDSADETLAKSYASTFDWTTDTVSIVIVRQPTRKELDNALYFHNPALYRDTSSTSPVTPSPQPTIGSGGAQNFTFQTGGAEALDNTTIVDTIDKTPLTTAEQQGWMMWRPMINWLKDWDTASTKVVGLNDAGAAVSQQSWGTNAVMPQAIEQVYLHGSELWVQVVFEDFVKLGSGITDSDGDGRVEVYAKVNTDHYTAEVVTALQDEYIAPTFNTHGLSKQINNALNELYTATSAEMEKYIGQSFDVPNVGTIQYPFAVINHTGANDKKNVLLVGP